MVTCNYRRPRPVIRRRWSCQDSGQQLYLRAPSRGASPPHFREIGFFEMQKKSCVRKAVVWAAVTLVGAINCGLCVRWVIWSFFRVVNQCVYVWFLPTTGVTHCVWISIYDFMLISIECRIGLWRCFRAYVKGKWQILLILLKQS